MRGTSALLAGVYGPGVIVFQGRLMRAPQNVSWAVYLMAVRGHATAVRAVCERGEWEAMERAQPCRHTLIQSGIATEGEAERFARVGAAAAAAASTATA